MEKLKFAKALKIIVLLLFSCSVLHSQCPGNLYIYTQAEVDSFPKNYPNCSSIPGDVEILGDVNNLNALSSITSIGGNLDIRDADNLADLWGLENLTNVEYLAIRESDNIMDLSALNNLTSVKAISIQNTQAAILPNFENISSKVEFVRIFDNSLLQQVGMPSNVQIEGYVQIYRNENLRTISGFEGFIGGEGNFDDLNIQQNDKLMTITGFSNFKSGEALRIGQNPNLTAIPSFQSLQTLRNGMSIDINPKLEEISGFTSLEYAASVTITNNGIREIQGFESLEKVDYNFTIVNATNLEFIPHFLQLRKVGGIYIWNTGLETFDAFSSLDSVLMQGILFRENAKLFSIEGFDNLKFSTHTAATLNPMLADCRAFCAYRAHDPEENSIGFINNAPGCNSLMEVDSTCLDTIGEIQVFDVILNTFNGNHSIQELEGLNLDFYKDGEKEVELTSDEAGLVAVTLNQLDSTANYQLEAYMGANPALTMKYDNITLEMLSQDTFRIEYPDRLLDTILSLQKQLANKMAKAEYAGGTLSLDYSLNGYNIDAIKMPITLFSKISEEHESVVEAMKRLGFGLHMVNLYFDDGIAMSAGMSKAFVETTLGLVKLIKELFKLKTGFNNSSAAQLADKQLEAANETITSIIKFLYSLSKKYYVNPKLASLENNKDTKDLAKAIKRAQVVFEASIFGAGGLVESTFVDVVYNAMAQQIIEGYYVSSATQGQVNGLATSHEKIDNIFPDIVSISNQLRTTTESKNAQAVQNAELIGGFGEDVGNFADILDNSGLAVQIATLGTGSALGLGLRTLAKGMKAGVITLNGVNFLSYGYRLSSLPSELNQITGQFMLNPPFESGQYDQAFLDGLISDLDFETKLMLLENIQNAFSTGDQVQAASNYSDFLKFYAATFEPTFDALYSVISNMGSEILLNGQPDEEFLQIEEEFRRVLAQKMTLDVNFIAHLTDLENDTIEEQIINEIDTIKAYLESFPDLVSSFFLDNISGDFPPLLSITNVTYPDSFLMSAFPAKITIRNLGPLTSEAFNIQLAPNENCELNVLESQLEDLVLESGEEHVLEIELTPLTENLQNSIYLEFENGRGIDESIIFTFNDQFLAFDIASGIADIPIESKEQVIFPNPARNEIFIHDRFLTEIKDYQIFDFNGRILKFGAIKEGFISIHDLPAGIYTIFLSGDNRSYIEKLVVF